MQEQIHLQFKLSKYRKLNLPPAQFDTQNYQILDRGPRAHPNLMLSQHHAFIYQIQTDFSLNSLNLGFKLSSERDQSR